MRQFIFRGTATLSGVTFYISARSEKDAVARAKRGDWDDYDTSGADTTDWQIKPDTCEENK